MVRDNKKVSSIAGTYGTSGPFGFGQEGSQPHKYEVKQAHEQVFRQMLVLSKLKLSSESLVSLLDQEKSHN